MQASVTITLNGSGNGRAILGPTIPRERWAPSYATVSASSNNLESQCSLYLGVGTNPGQLIATTVTGSTGDTCGFAGFEMQGGQNIVANWTGGDPGATATLAIFGERKRPGS